MIIPAVFPEAFPEVKGIFVGGCVARGDGSRFRRWAHAHNYKKDEHYGWVCVLSSRRCFGTKGWSRTLWHEYAHILTPNHGHDDVWRAKMKELGQPVKKHHQKKRQPK